MLNRRLAWPSALAIFVLVSCATDGHQAHGVSALPQPAPQPPPSAPEPNPLPRPPPLAVAVPTHVRVPSRGCVEEASSSDLSEAMADNARFNRGALEQELQRQGLTVLSLPSTTRELHRGVSGQGAAPGPVPARMIPGPSQWSGQGTAPEVWQFVQTCPLNARRCWCVAAARLGADPRVAAVGAAGLPTSACMDRCLRAPCTRVSCCCPSTVRTCRCDTSWAPALPVPRIAPLGARSPGRPRGLNAGPAQRARCLRSIC